MRMFSCYHVVCTRATAAAMPCMAQIEQVFDAGVEEEISLGRSAHAAFCQQLGHEKRKSGGLGQRRGGRVGLG